MIEFRSWSLSVKQLHSKRSSLYHADDCERTGYDVLQWDDYHKDAVAAANDNDDYDDDAYLWLLSAWHCVGKDDSVKSN